MRRMSPVADQCHFLGNEARVYPNHKKSRNVDWSLPLATTNGKDPSSISRGSQATTLVENSYRPRRPHATRYVIIPSKERSYPVRLSPAKTKRDDTTAQTVYQSSRLQRPRQSVYVHQDRRQKPHVSGRQAGDDGQTEDGGGSMRNVNKDSADLWDSIEDEILPGDSVSRPHDRRGLPNPPISRPYTGSVPHNPYPVSHYPPPLRYPPHHGSMAIPSSPPPPPHLAHIPYYQPILWPTYIPPVAPTSEPPFSAPEPLDTKALAKLIASSKEDPIKIVEEYLESLRGTKETELLEANRILTWIDRHFR
jgi:hypothetical protein